MSRDLYLITGATGDTGGYAIDSLLAKDASVRAFVHNEDDRAAALRRKGVEVVTGDLLDGRAVRAALQGVTGAYCIPGSAVAPRRCHRVLCGGGEERRRPFNRQHVADFCKG